MKKIDLYILKKFLGTFFFTVLLFIAIAVVIDLSEKIDDFSERGAPFEAVIFDYYVNFIPYIVLLLSPLFVFIAVIFFTSRLAGRSEIIAILGSGVSFYRIFLVPYLLGAVILMSLQLVANHFVVPNANKVRVAFEDQYFKKSRLKKGSRDIHFQMDSVHYAYVKTFSPIDSTGRLFSLERFGQKGLEKKLTSKKIKLKENGICELSNWQLRTFNGLKETLKEGEKLDTLLHLTPGDFVLKTNTKETMNTPELISFIEKQRLKGAGSLEFFELERHSRTALPVATIILTLIGFSMASKRVRGGMGLHILIGIALSSIYVVFMRFSNTFSTNAGLEPMLAAWLPNIIFGILSLYLLKIAPK